MARANYGQPLLADSAWVFTEKLPYGGALQVTPETWQIEYSFYAQPEQIKSWGTIQRVGRDGSPPVHRLYIPADTVNDLYQGWLKNFSAFEKLANSLPAGSVTVIPGECNMVIRIGVSPEGVAFADDSKAISTRAALKTILASYEYAVARAREVRRFLRASDDESRQRYDLTSDPDA